MKRHLTFSYLQTVSCYALLSKDNILNPQPTGQQITLPFYPGHRYAAVPGSSINNVLQVDIFPRRPASLVYHDHCFHLMDIRVNLSYSHQFLFNLSFVSLAYRFPKICSLTKLGKIRTPVSSLTVLSK